MKNANFYVLSANLPGISGGPVITSTMLNKIKSPGDEVEYEDLSVTFLVDEHLESWREIHNWMVPMMWAKKQKDYPTKNSDRYSDASLTILTSHHNAYINVKFIDAFPVSLSAIDFSYTEGTIDYPSFSVEFTYNYYEIETMDTGTF